ncbi:MAG: ubiquinol-cytochrome c reductase iron-sulfur subunit [Neomegalonema sp.]|nr:ubiquinol-cytochrome c reductase iron-sulfur subunit [Neomegalonema sp.]
MAHSHSDTEATRRDFLYIATGAVGAVTAGAAVWPLINQMNPDASARALASTEVDVSNLGVGQQLTVMWRGKPVFIRHRSEAEIEQARETTLSDLIDPASRNNNLAADAPADDANRTLERDPANPTGEWLVVMGVCTHLGCVPLGNGAGDFNGWYCPCHGSHYDSAGRIRKGPAPENLHIPQTAFIDENTIKIG